MTATFTLPVPTFGAPEVIERNGHRYRIECIPDEDSSVMRDDFYGEFAWETRHPDTGRGQRPDGFDGAAHKIPPDQMIDAGLWWQPPGDVPADRIADMKATVIDLLRWGFNGYTVSRLETCDHGHEHVVDSASLWGVESTLIDGIEGYVRNHVLPDLLAEVAP